MSTKKITDLTLIDEAKDTLNFAADDTIQTYRTTALQLKDYILPDDGVTTAKIVDGAVTADKIADATTQVKFLASDLSVATNPISALTFPLVLGASYELEVMAYMLGTGSSNVIAVDNSTMIFIVSAGQGEVTRTPSSIKFIAQGTSLTFQFNVSGSKTLNGDGTLVETYARLTKLPYNIVEGTL